MYLQDFTGDKQTVLERAFQSPKLSPKKTPTAEMALRVIGDTAKKLFIENGTRELHIDILDAVSIYEVTNGDYSEIPDGDEHKGVRDDYESGIDDAIEAALEKYDDYLSANWLGVNTIDTQCWESDPERKAVEALALSAAKEIYKNLTADKTPAQAIASAGITTQDVEDALKDHLAKGPDTMDANTDSQVMIIEKMATYLGKDFDQMAVYDDIDMSINEDDDILANAAAARLGLDEADRESLQVEALAFEDDPANDIILLVQAFKPVSGRKKAAAAKKAKADAKQAEAQGGIDSAILSGLKECGVGDTAMAESLGVSRSTYTNYIKGKTAFSPDNDQYTLLREELVTRANLLLNGLALLDGTEPLAVA